MLNGNSNGILAPVRRSEESKATPDSMWHPGVDRIRRSEESKATPDSMWHPGVDRIRRSEESKATPDII